MSGTSVVILSNGSVFVESIASRLRQQLKASNVRTIDSRQTDALEQVIAAQPAIVIVETTSLKQEQVCPLSRLLMTLPKLTIIRLDSQQEHMHILTSEHRPSGGMSGLIRTIRSVRSPRAPTRPAQRAAPTPGSRTRKEPNLDKIY